MSSVEVRIPDLGDVKDVTVLDVLIASGAEIRRDDPIVTLESEKASMDVPSPVAGVVASVNVKRGDPVTSGTLVAMVEEAGAAVAPAAAAGRKVAFDARCIPSVAYTDPQIAWVGVSETDAKARGVDFGKAVFPWSADR
jgi:pyruvate dehydrogenase E2 component (dihydrolipoamide acetyltransferase)